MFGNNGFPILMRNLSISTQILDKDKIPQCVLTFLDYSKSKECWFHRLECEDGSFLEASPEHLVYIKFNEYSKEGKPF